MRSALPHALRSYLCRWSLVVTTAALAACSGGAAPNTLQMPAAGAGPAAMSFMLPTVTRLFHSITPLPVEGRNGIQLTNGPLLTTVQAYGSDADVYTVKPPAAERRGHLDAGTTLTFLEQFSTGLKNPFGTRVTPSGDWYIANSGDNNVPVYHVRAPLDGPFKTLNDSGGVPIDVDSTPTNSLVAVSNYTSTGSGSIAGFVTLYANGATNPTGTLSVTGPAYGVGIALDKGGNCYWSYNTSLSGGGLIVEFASCTGPARTIITGLHAAGGMAFNKAGQLFYVDPTAGTLNRCTNNGGWVCKVLQKNFTEPTTINFDAQWKHLWLADFGSSTIYALNPKTGTILSTTPAHGGPSDPPFGIAPAPGTPN
jgi:hypothetical protein